MIMKLYIYDINSGDYLYTDSGKIEDILYDLGDNKDFTLTPPPITENPCMWVDGNWVEKQKSLDLQRLENWQAIKSERSSKIESGVLVESTGKVFQTDNHSLTQYANIAGMIALDNYEPIEWKTTDNSFVLLTVDVFKELQQAINRHTQDAFKEAEEKRVADTAE